MPHSVQNCTENGIYAKASIAAVRFEYRTILGNYIMPDESGNYE